MEKNEKKLFTNEESNNIIRKNNPSKANKCEREGLPIKEMNELVLQEIKQVLTAKEIEVLERHTEICVKIYKKGIEKGFNAKM